MICVDSSVWIDFFNGDRTPQTLWLLERLGNERICIGDLVLLETLQGFRQDRAFDAALVFLKSFEQLVISDETVALQAARNYRLLRARGITIRKTIDTLIATRCIVEGWPLLYSDRDFDPFVEHLGLRRALD